MAVVAANYKNFQDLDVEVLTMSIDSVFVHKMWNDKELSKMVDGGVFPSICFQMQEAGSEQVVVPIMKMPAWKTGAGSLSIRMESFRPMKF